MAATGRAFNRYLFKAISADVIYTCAVRLSAVLAFTFVMCAAWE